MIVQHCFSLEAFFVADMHSVFRFLILKSLFYDLEEFAGIYGFDYIRISPPIQRFDSVSQ